MTYCSAMSDDQRRTVHPRWLGAAELLSVVRAEPGITRAAAAQRLGIGTGQAADMVARLRQMRLLDETPAPAQGRGRPTTVLGPHPGGPLVLAGEVRVADWRLAVAGVDGAPHVVAGGAYADTELDAALDRLAEAIGAAYRRDPTRVRALAVSFAGTVSDGKPVQFTSRRRRDVDLSTLTSRLPPDADVAVLIGNDATWAGLAEARTGAARDAGTSLHLIVAQGIGGTVVVNGEPLCGTHGAAGEYGHIPFGDPALACPCGARGCWDLTVDGRALARLLGDAPPEDPVGYAHRVLDGPRDAAARRALTTVAASLGRGIGALVNLHDPEVVTLGGVGAGLRAAAAEDFDTAYRDALMTYRRDAPPPVRDAEHGEHATLHGAVIMAMNQVTSPAGLADWAERQRV
ncbi:xylose repressor [Mycolicibacterium vaccae ATCC 25954]|uniref:Xylose repressor n=4 Tax=Mycolicibacterium vaccae TaxID=1810 RepID=K0ULV3_MYCVA|nr:xylose repressor [Mycolicibacterium vaccae 95051]EJZ08157.1 xylose repressor [Mycolicibacterium vaccae ATCC 25954]